MYNWGGTTLYIQVLQLAGLKKRIFFYFLDFRQLVDEVRKLEWAEASLRQNSSSREPLVQTSLASLKHIW
jgi:hypothetical protein